MVRTLVRSLALSLCALFVQGLFTEASAQSAFTCDTSWYIVTGDSAPPRSQLYRIDRSTSPFSFVPIGPPTTTGGGYPNGFQVNALGFNPLDNFMYAVVRRPAAAGPFTDDDIVRIDSSGMMTSLGEIPALPNVSSGAFLQDGTYVVGGGNRLIRVDLATSSILSNVTVTGVSFTDFAVNPTDTNPTRVYFVDESGGSDTVRFADAVTGALQGSLPNPTGTNINAGSQFFDSFGTLYYRSNTDLNLYRVDMAPSSPTRGQATLITGGPAGGQHDGASCAFEIGMTKIVTPGSTAPGTRVTYTYEISNPRSLPVSGLTFTDTMADGRTFVAGTLASTLSGAVGAYGGTNTLTITGATADANTLEQVTIDVDVPLSAAGLTVFNQANLSGLSPSLGGAVVSDYPPSAPFGDPTPLIVLQPTIGAAKSAGAPIDNGDGTFDVTYTLNFENLGSVELFDIQAGDDLTGPFGTLVPLVGDVDAPGEYFVTAAPSITANSTNPLTANSAFDGSGSTDLFDLSMGGSLPLGETVTVQFTARFFPDFVNAPFSNQATASGDSTANGTADGDTTDLSDSGTDPDPDGNGDPTDPGEDDPTNLIIPMQVIGVAKSLSNAVQTGPDTFDVDFTMVVENLGTVAATNVQVSEDLAATFAAASSFSVAAGPTVTGGLSAANVGFDGDTDGGVNPTDIFLLAGNETLAAGQTGTIVLTVRVDTGGNPGPYSNQVTATTAGAPGGPPLYSDLSDDGVDPDPDGDGNPDEPGENDPTSFTLPPQIIGAAKELTGVTQIGANSYRFDFSLVLENLSPTEPATNVQLSDDLTTAFPGASSISLVAGPAVSGGLSAANGGYDGDTDGGANPTDVFLLAGNESLAIGQTATITFTIDVDLGGATGPFTNQATATTAVVPGGPPLFIDPSDSGTDPDPDGDGNPNESGENDPTDVTITMQVIGVAKSLGSVTQISPTTFDVDFTLVVENLGTVPSANVQVVEDLAATFAAASSFALTSGPTVSGGLSAANLGFDGDTDGGANPTDTHLLAGNESLAVGQTATITLTVRVDTGGNTGPYDNQVTATTALTPGGPPLSSDLSDNGIDPDPDGDGNPNEADENDPTSFTLPPQIIGAAKEVTGVTQVGPSTYRFDFSLVLENLSSTEPATNVQLSDELTTAFPGASSISIVAGPAVSGGLSAANAGYDGDTDGGANPTDVFLLAGNESLAIGQTATITFTAEVNLGNAAGPFTNQATATTAVTPGGPPLSIDPSDSGTDPDPDGDGNPNESGENDPTEVVIDTQAIGVAKSVSSITQTGPAAFDVAFNIVVENLGSVPATNVQISEDLAAAFAGAAGFSITAGPDIAGGLGALNAGFDGNTDGGANPTEIFLLTGDETLAIGETANITLTVQVDTGGASGGYENQVAATTAITPGGPPVSEDLSDDGIDPDPDGDGNANESGENDPTPIVLDGQQIGVAKRVAQILQVGPTTFDVTYQITIRNLSAGVPATNVQATDDLGGAFPGVADLTLISVDTAGLTANASYDGTTDLELLEGTDTLAPGASETLTLRLAVDIGNAGGPFANQVVGTSSDTPGGTPLSIDESTIGINPDPNDNGDPGDPGEDEPTDTVLEVQRLGAAKEVSDIRLVGSTTFDVDFAFVVENLSTSVTATNVQVSDDLQSALPGVAGITVLEGPTADLLTPNPDFDGVQDHRLLSGSDQMAPGQLDVVRFTARIDIGSATGPFVNQALATASVSPDDPPLVTDKSDAGSEPDEDGDGNPSEENEDDPTTFTLAPPSVLIEKTVDRGEAGPGDVLLYVIRAENMGASSLPGMMLSDNLPGGFRFVPDTATLVRAGEDGVLGTPDDVSMPLAAEGIDPIAIGPVDLALGETVAVRYFVQVSSGVARGQFTNRAAPLFEGSPIGNEASATVDVVSDALFERTTVIGKVWNDRDGDGWQDEADASGIVLSGGPFGASTAVPDLPGRRRATDPPATASVPVEAAFQARDVTEPILLSTAEGTVLSLGPDGTVEQLHRGAKEAGRTAQDLRIEWIESGSGAQRRLTLEISNQGIFEEGIPGTRISSVEGLTIETDAFGRYHLADVDVARFERGANFILKVDPTTLPEGARFTTENPRVIRLTPSLMSRVNFGVQLPAAVLVSVSTVPTTEEGDVLPHSGVVWATEDPLVQDARLDVLALEEIVISDDGAIAPVRFALYSNYNAYIDGWELRIFDGDDTDLVRPIATLTGDTVSFEERPAWRPESGTLEPGSELSYVLRVHDAEGKFDETRPRRLAVVSESRARSEQDEPQPGPEQGPEAGDGGARLDDAERKARQIYGQSNLERQNISVAGSRVRVHGADVSGDYSVTVDGHAVPVSEDGSFVFDAQMPIGRHDITVELADEAGERFARSLEVDVQSDYRFLVGLASLTVGQNDVGGSIEPLSADDHFDGEVFVDGRVAFYAKGKIKGKYLITAQLDTTEDELRNLGDRLGETDPRRIFRQLDPDRYYPVYGDDSTTTSDVDTQGAFYVRVDFDKNEFLWGNFNTGMTDTEFMQYDRSLYGGMVRHENGNTTSYGDARTEGTLFVSEAQSVFGHNTFLATGGSLYYLRHTGIVEGSEKVLVEVRRRGTQQVVERQTLLAGRDYEIDPLQGRILLRRPLNPVVNERGPAIIRSRPLEGDDVFLLVDYEYVPVGFAADNLSYGGRGKLWLGDHLGIGATGVKDERDVMDYELRGIDATLRGGMGTYFKVEYSQSEARQSDSNLFSVDGGLTFSNKRPDQGPVDGDALAFEGRVNLAEVNPAWSGDVRAWWKNRDAGFSIARLLDGVETREAGVELVWQPLPLLALQGGYREIERAGFARDAEARVQADVTAGRFIAGVEIRNEQRDDLDNGTSGDATLAGGRLGYNITPETSIYGTAQAVVASDGILDTADEDNQNDLVAAGVNSRLSSQLGVSLEASTGDRGEAVTAGVDFAPGDSTHLALSSGIGGGATSQIGASYAISEAHELYGSYTMDPDRTEGPKNTLTFGQRRDFGNSLSIFSEEQFGKGDRLASSAHVFGLDFAATEDWVVTGSLLFSDVERPDDIVKRLATSVGASLYREDIDLSTRFELRHDDGLVAESRQYLTSNAFRWRASASHSWQAKLNLSWTDDRFAGGQLARFTELDLGHAYRPTRNDRWNVLAKYSYFYDLPSIGQATLRPDQRSHIFSAETIYALTQRWEVGGKIAVKFGQLRMERDAGDWVDQGLLLGALRARYHFVDNWDALVEYRRLETVGGDDVRGGVLIALYRHLMEQFKVGVGYNFTDFDDQLKDESYTNNGWFFDIVWKR